jgi:hypothetical protein
MGVPQRLIALTIAVVLLVVAYRLGYRNGYRGALRRAAEQRGHPSDTRVPGTINPDHRRFGSELLSLRIRKALPDSGSV